MNILWAALIFAVGMLAGASLALLTIVLIASRVSDGPESLYRGGESQ